MRASIPIEDYAIIGDCRSAALVSRDGSIDWLCWPRFESPSLFGALLDPDAGSWRIGPRGPVETRRRYDGESAVLETTFHAETGEVVLTDAMPISTPEQAKRVLTPEHELVRIVRCTRGTMTIDVVFDPRPGFGRGAVARRDRGKLGLRFETAEGLLTLRTDATNARFAAGADTRWTLTLAAGDEVHFSLSFSVDAPAVLPPLGEWSRASVARTVENWHAWSSRTRFVGPDREKIVRSAITVRLLAYAPSGAIVAAPTTSLPERVGGSHNWDYRFCWLRDAAFTVRGLLELGHAEEAIGFTQWLLHATRLTQPKLMVLYDVYGRKPPRERSLAHLAGYRGSAPVRVGNGADDQLQLDSYGEVIDAVWRVTRAGMPLDRETCGVLEDFGRVVADQWRRPDAGIWEPRGAPKMHTHSLGLCWTALDRLLDLQQRGQMRSRHRDRFASERAAIAALLDARAYNEELGSFTAELDGTKLDATSLLLGWYGFAEPSSPRMKSTFASLMRELSPRPGLLYRYRKDDDPEGAFGVCSFWIAEHLARGGGTLEEAVRAFAATSAFANDVGLFAEEIDASTGAAVGNFPQTFTHVGHLNAALSIRARAKGEDAS